MKVEILMITGDRPAYEKKSKASLADQTFKDFQLTIIENPGNKRSIADITSKVFMQSKADLVGKIDDDMLVPPDWLERLVEAHEAFHFGYIGGFHFRKEEMADIQPKITEYNGIKIWEKPHIGGNFLMRREDFAPYGGENYLGLSDHQHQTAHNGYLFPFIFTDHMQDGRSAHCVREYQNKFGMGTDVYTETFIRDSIPYLKIEI